MQAAAVAVNAAESLMGNVAGSKKYDAVFECLRDMGIKADKNAITTAIEAAYNQMRIAMVAAGLKEKPPDAPGNPEKAEDVQV